MVDIRTELTAVDAQDPDREVIKYAARIIETGGLVVLPTDTVYGLVCDCRQPEAVDRVYEVKERSRDLPLILLLHDMAQAAAYVENVPDNAVLAMQQFWPGPLTVVLRDTSEATAAVRAGGDTVGLRLPAHMAPRLLAGELGAPLASTSANTSRQPPAINARQALDYLDGKVSLVLDSGPAPLSQESTVVSFLDDHAQVLREGAITVARLREVLGVVTL